jgi:hypothetical protein
MRRLDDRLASIDAEELVHATRRRAAVRRYRTSESFLAAVREAVVPSGTSAMKPSTSRMDQGLGRVDGYCTSEAAELLEHDLHLVEDSRGNVTLRVAATPTVSLEGRGTMPVAVVAADLAEALETRERSAGLRVLERLLR